MLLDVGRCLLLSLLLAGCSLSLCKLREGDCEVCIKFLSTFARETSDAGVMGKEAVTNLLKKKCSTAAGKDGRLCYYMGATEDSATGILMDVVKPLLSNVPAEKICEKLKTMDAQLCELTYEKTIDFKNTDLSKLRVRELRKILSGWGESCLGCAEKTDFVKRVQELLPKHEEL